MAGYQVLARQFVRYLRNTIMAKITGLLPDAEATGAAADLLQISPEERHRAARSAALFTEEELSRFLAIMLRTFDELGYRQEQRFHLELGLLKLVHAQRLVPVEELLSQLGAKPSKPTNTAPRATATASAPISSGAARTSSTQTTAAPSFDADRTRKTPTAFASTTATSVAPTAGSLALADRPAPSAKSESSQTRPHLVVSAPEPAILEPPIEAPVIEAPAIHATPIHTKEIVAEPISSPTDAAIGYDIASLQTAFATALGNAKGHDSASHQIEEATLKINGELLEVQTSVSAAMIPLLFNTEADRILKSVLREQNAATLKLKFLPGTASTSAPAKKISRPTAAGSAADLAARHPIVQQAQRLFSAEIIKVDDLRDKD